MICVGRYFIDNVGEYPEAAFDLFFKCSASRLNSFYIIIYPSLTSVSIPLLSNTGD